MQTQCLVTGGAGFIGSNLVRVLLESGHSVRVLDDLSTGRAANLDGLSGRIEFIEGDVRNAAVAQASVRGVRWVFHLAAMPSVQGSVDDPVTSDAVNAGGTLNVLDAARRSGVERFVLSSSSAVYGNDPELPKREGMRPEPLSPYAVQKLTGEQYCRIFHALYGLKTYALRYFNVFGPRQNPASAYAAVVPAFIAALNAGRSPVIHGDGGQTRDFVFVDDVAGANIACCTAPDRAAGEACNVAWGRSMTINELAAQIAVVMGRKAAAAHDEARPGEVRHSRADTAKARDLLGWTPRVPFEEGLRRTVDWFSHVPR